MPLNIDLYAIDRRLRRDNIFLAATRSLKIAGVKEKDQRLAFFDLFLGAEILFFCYTKR